MFTTTNVVKGFLLLMSAVWLIAAFINPFCWMSGIPQGYGCSVGLPVYVGQAEAYQLGGVSLLVAVLIEQAKRTGWWTSFAICVAHLAIAAGLVVSLMYANPHLSKLQMGITIPMLVSTLVLLYKSGTPERPTIQERNRALDVTLSVYRALKQSTDRHHRRD
ncbi:MAG: hypothetical protein OXL37_01980 [Chloroflexota bacterium]|nr:hypothetical protein [Chloroflexota bacterium]MDE2961503.1 hypothetical protein [Chloroflexota bacterium]